MKYIYNHDKTIRSKVTYSKLNNWIEIQLERKIRWLMFDFYIDCGSNWFVAVSEQDNIGIGSPIRLSFQGGGDREIYTTGMLDVRARCCSMFADYNTAVEHRNANERKFKSLP
jgi:hypothetical protein